MSFRPPALLTAFFLVGMLAGCGTDTETTGALDAAPGKAHYGGVWIDGNDNPLNRAQYMGYSGELGTAVAPAVPFVFTINCASCHANSDTAANATILKQYAESGHGDVTAIPWTVPEYGTSCQRCHTSIGFANYLAGNAAVALTAAQQAAYKSQMQVLTCNACHSSVVDGSLAANADSIYTATWSQNSVTASVTFPDAGKSNLCIRCHSARRAGANITTTATTTAHYLPAATILFGGTSNLVNITANTSTGGIPAIGTKYTGGAYEFLVQANYTTTGFAHKNSVGMFGSSPKGPCVGCHMGGEAGHTWEVVSKDATGVITKLNNPLCSGCHSDMSVSTLNERRTAFNAAVNQLAVSLQAKGFFFNPEDNAFYKDAAFTLPLRVGADRTAQDLAENTYYNDQATAFSLSPRDLRGAAYNLWLFNASVGDPAAYVHNVNYSKKILFDTLDYLDNGALGGTIDLSGPGQATAAAYLDGDDTVPNVQRP